MLRRIRIILAALFFIGVTLLFVDVTDTARRLLGWMARVQFLPAVMALNLGVIAGLVLLTLLCGRVYCSVVCPLGVMQDIVARLQGGLGRKNRYRFRPARPRLRWGALAAFVLLSALGVHSLALLLAPYSAYGRIAQNLLAPLYRAGNNVLAHFAERADSYAFAARDICIAGLPTFAVAALTFGVIATLARRGGRTWCNTLCPVGTILGIPARFAWFKPALDRDRCVKCRACERRCKAGCIDLDRQRVDYSRCVACMNCIDACAKGAMRFAHAGGSPAFSTARRGFLLASAAMAATAAGTARAAEEHLTDGGLAELKPRKPPKRTLPVRPPGAASQKNFTTRCTACQLCVAACPNGVLRPSAAPLALMQPEMSFERGWCRPECVRCAEVCPTGAIRRIGADDKSAVHTGAAIWDKTLCLPATGGDACGNCERHCPNGSISLVDFTAPNGDAVRVPAVDRERCLGCGACEYVCPARPRSAIHVDGYEAHKIA